MRVLPKGRIIGGSNYGLELNLDNMDTFLITPASVREIAMKDGIVSGPGIDMAYMPTSRELDTINEMAKFAVDRGQMIDFGYWPNDMIMATGHRAGNLYSEGALGHPFSTPYIILHTWNDPKLLPDVGNPNEKSSSAYLVNPFPYKDSKDLCIDFEAMTLEGLIIEGYKCLGVGDRALLNGKETSNSKNYAVQVIPFAARWASAQNNTEFMRAATNRNNDDINIAAAGNVMDPIMTALLMLNTRGIRQEIISASDKLNKARLKSNKPPIPPYRRIDSASYVTVVLNRVNRRGPGTGTHASPVMHMRQGHWRHYATGEKSFIRDTLVNATEEQRQLFITGRSHYVVKE
jgi:hypothetical protein